MGEHAGSEGSPSNGVRSKETARLIVRLELEGDPSLAQARSASAEHGMKEETLRANILEINPDGSGKRIVASGLRNPVGIYLFLSGQINALRNSS